MQRQSRVRVMSAMVAMVVVAAGLLAAASGIVAQALVGIGDEFDTMDDWVEFPRGGMGTMWVADGALYLQNKVADAPFGYQLSTAELGECDIVMRVRSENSDWGPDYGIPGGHIMLGVAKTEATPYDELYLPKNVGTPANGFSIYMSFRDQDPEPSWWAYSMEDGWWTRRDRFGHSFYEPGFPWHDVVIQVRADYIRVEVDGEELGVTDWSIPLSVERRLWLTAYGGNAQVDYIRVFEYNPIVPVGIDIKPGSDVNPINLGSNGVTPVAILSDAGLDAAMVDDSTVVMASALVDGIPHLEDVDGDGDEDLVCHFRTQDLALDATSVEAVLSGMTVDGTLFEGSDVVWIVPYKGKKGKKG